MKKNQGITFITLIITVLVLVLIVSFTVYDGIDTLQKAKKNDAMNIVQSVYFSLLINEDVIPALSGDSVSDYQFTNDDLIALGLSENTDYTITLSKSLDNNRRIYSFTYTDNKGHSYGPIEHTYAIDEAQINNIIEFDEANGVNRPVFPSYWETNAVAVKYVSGTLLEDGTVSNIYTDNWYSYKRGMAEIALAIYDGDTYIWIPRFAYKIQDYYLNKDTQRVPATAVDIIFLRGVTNNMPNKEALKEEYTLHPAFENNIAGFWVMLSPKEVSNFNDAINDSHDSGATADVAHLMKNKEYGAVALLLKYLDTPKYLSSGDVGFMPNGNLDEYVAATLNNSKNECDNYSSNINNVAYYGATFGHALADTPWELKAEIPALSEGVFIRNLSKGYFYYETSDGTDAGHYRRVISIK